MKIALTGAGGQVGSVLRTALSQRGFNLRSAGFRPLAPLFEGEDVCSGDLRDPEVVDAVLRDVDVLIHLAGTSTEQALEEIIENNLNALVHIYEGARRNKVRRIIFASSNHTIGMYSVNEPERLATDCAFRPDTFYGLSKMWGEGLARMYWDKYGIESVCLRIGSCLERPADFRHLSTWLGHQDLLHLMERCILAEKADFTVIWGVSANTRSYWANTLAAHIGYSPQQNSEDYAVEILQKENLYDPVAQRYQGGKFVTQPDSIALDSFIRKDPKGG